MAHDVFISYASGDLNAAKKACAELESGGIKCWMAPRDVTPGANWGGEIIKAIGQSRGMVLLLSSGANESKQVEREVERATSKGLWIITVRLELVEPTPSLEYYISSGHWLDAYGQPKDLHYAALPRAVRVLLDGQAEGGAADGIAPPAVEPATRPWHSGAFKWAMACASLIGIVTIGFLLLRPYSTRRAFVAEHDRYVIEFLRHNPTANTYLGGMALDQSLRELDGKLRDHSAPAIEAEDRWLAAAQRAFEDIEPALLTPKQRIDREVALAQIAFLLHQHRVSRYQERSLDTYTVEPFRSVYFYTQGMTQTGDATYGTPEEWATVVKRLQDFPRYMQVAQNQLLAGVRSGNTPDWRMLKRDGLDTCDADVKYFEKDFIDKAAKDVAQGPQRDELIKQLTEASKGAAAAYKSLGDFIRATFFDSELKVKSRYASDRYSIGEAEYNWRLRNNLHIDKTAAKLYEDSYVRFDGVRNLMMALARKIGPSHGLALPDDDEQALRDVMEELGKDSPKSDAEMLAWYKEYATRFVDYARKTGIFDVPADYKLGVIETPPPLRASIDGAAYYPAPPFKNEGTGSLYITPSGDNDPAILKENNRASIPVLLAHEGFPGHDWHYREMTQFRDQISAVRWLTPGAVEDSSAMWQDSMAAEGWALYAEALMAEPQPDAPDGFYTPEEHLYQLQSELHRNLRVRVDIGLHTGRLSFDDAVDLFSQVVNFLPGKCSDANLSEAKAASCTGARSAVFRYSKWPTQAITYTLGKEEIMTLREEVSRVMGDKFSLREFHLLFMRQGTIPSGYFREELLRALQQKK